MRLLSELISKTQNVPIPALLKERLRIPRRNERESDLEREALLVKIEKLTASNKALMEVAELDPNQQVDQLSNQEIDILKLIHTETVVSAREISDAFDFNLARAEYLLSGLLENGYLVDSNLLGRHSYLLDSRSRTYLAELDSN